jgi:hypothetical protein
LQTAQAAEAVGQARQGFAIAQAQVLQAA